LTGNAEEGGGGGTEIGGEGEGRLSGYEMTSVDTGTQIVGERGIWNVLMPGTIVKLEVRVEFKEEKGGGTTGGRGPKG